MCNFADSSPYTHRLWTTLVPTIPREIKLAKQATTYRLLYLISGELELVVTKQRHFMHAGDICFLTPGTQYVTTPISTIKVANLYFTFDSELSKIHLSDLDDPVLNAFAPIQFEDVGDFNTPCVLKSAILSKIMKRILNEDMTREAFYQQQINGMVKQLLIEMIRIRNASAQAAVLPPVMVKIIQYIDDNITEPLSVDQIAQAFSYHPVYINSLFKRYSGQTAHSFIVQKRIDSVEKTLRFTDMSITEVAQAYSFSDCSHLSRVFRKIKGISPSEIRREANETSFLLQNQMD